MGNLKAGTTIGGYEAWHRGNLVPQIIITTAINIGTSKSDSRGISQDGCMVVIDNGVNNISINVDIGVTSTYLKHGTGTITFTQGAGRTLVLVPPAGGAVLNGIAGSIATITSVGTIDYLKISNS